MKNNTLILRKMEQRDIPSVKYLEKQSNLSQWSVDDYLESLKNKNLLNLVAYTKSENEEIIVGFITARLITIVLSANDISSKISESESEIEIYNIAVDLNRRRQGIGKKLLSECLKYAPTDNNLKIWLEVRALNYNAIEFYKKLGFTAKYIRKLFYSNPPEDAVVMSLQK